jgi:hypothetical protein
MHGGNPLNLAYLSKMETYGAENSAPEFYHGWFKDGSEWDSAEKSLYGPAPGFVPGGVTHSPALGAALQGMSESLTIETGGSLDIATEAVFNAYGVVSLSGNLAISGRMVLN